MTLRVSATRELWASVAAHSFFGPPALAPSVITSLVPGMESCASPRRHRGQEISQGGHYGCSMGKSPSHYGMMCDALAARRERDMGLAREPRSSSVDGGHEGAAYLPRVPHSLVCPRLCPACRFPLSHSKQTSAASHLVSHPSSL